VTGGSFSFPVGFSPSGGNIWWGHSASLLAIRVKLVLVLEVATTVLALPNRQLQYNSKEVQPLLLATYPTRVRSYS
jgi:hypothetical protein